MSGRQGCICRAFERAVIAGTLYDLPGRPTRGKVSEYWPALKEILQMLKAGREVEGSERRAWTSLEELVKVYPSVEELMAIMGITTITSLWRLLQQSTAWLEDVCNDSERSQRTRAGTGCCPANSGP